MGLCHGKPTEPPQNLSEIHGENRAQNNNSSTGKPPKFPFYSPSPLPSAFKNSPANLSSVSSTPLRFFKRPFPPPSPAKHIKALLARRHGSVKPNEATIPEGGESEIVGLDKNFGFCKNFASHYAFGEEIGRGHFGYTSAAVGKKGAMKGQDVAVKVILNQRYFLDCFKPQTGFTQDESVGAPMKREEQVALYSAIQDFVGKWWNGSDLYPDPCGWTPIQSYSPQSILQGEKKKKKKGEIMSIGWQNLKSITALELSNTSLTGGIPESLTHLKSLRFTFDSQRKRGFDEYSDCDRGRSKRSKDATCTNWA